MARGRGRGYSPLTGTPRLRKSSPYDVNAQAPEWLIKKLDQFIESIFSSRTRSGDPSFALLIREALDKLIPSARRDPRLKPLYGALLVREVFNQKDPFRTPTRALFCSLGLVDKYSETIVVSSLPGSHVHLRENKDSTRTLCGLSINRNFAPCRRGEFTQAQVREALAQTWTSASHRHFTCKKCLKKSGALPEAQEKEDFETLSPRQAFSLRLAVATAAGEINGRRWPLREMDSNARANTREKLGRVFLKSLYGLAATEIEKGQGGTMGKVLEAGLSKPATAAITANYTPFTNYLPSMVQLTKTISNKVEDDLTYLLEWDSAMFSLSYSRNLWSDRNPARYIALDLLIKRWPEAISHVLAAQKEYSSYFRAPWENELRLRAKAVGIVIPENI